MNWNDPTFLRSASAVIQWCVIGFASIAVCLQTAKHFVDLREKRISSELTRLKEAGQQERERELRQKLETSERKIRSLDLEVTVGILAKWKDGKVPDSGGESIFTPKAAALSLVLRDGREIPVIFDRVQNIHRETIDQNVPKLSYRTIAIAGPVLGIVPSEIETIKDFGFQCFGLTRQALDETVVTVRSLLKYLRHAVHTSYSCSYSSSVSEAGSQEV